MLYIQIKSRSHSLKRPYLFKGLLPKLDFIRNAYSTN